MYKPDLLTKREIDSKIKNEKERLKATGKSNSLISVGGVTGLSVRIYKLSNGDFASMWFFRIRHNGKLKGESLGAYDRLSIRDARDKALNALLMVKSEGVTPKERQKQLESNAIDESVNRLSLGGLLEEYFKYVEGVGKRTKQEVRRSRGRVKGWMPETLLNASADSVKTVDIAELMTKNYSEHKSTLDKLKGDIKQAYDWANASGLYGEMKNPAEWGSLSKMLPKVNGNKHRPALSPNDVPEFFYELLRNTPNVSRLCIAFILLTGGRVSEYLGSTADGYTGAKHSDIVTKDINGVKRKFLRIPRERMKVKDSNKGDFLRPISTGAEIVLGLLSPFNTYSEFLFPSPKDFSRSIKAESLEKTLREDFYRLVESDGVQRFRDAKEVTRDGIPKKATIHGTARATFKAWAKDGKTYRHKAFQIDHIEEILDHTHTLNGAYDRHQPLGEMTEILDEWGEYCLKNCKL